jgi:hypothetical protein
LISILRTSILGKEATNVNTATYSLGLITQSPPTKKCQKKKIRRKKTGRKKFGKRRSLVTTIPIMKNEPALYGSKLTTAPIKFSTATTGVPKTTLTTTVTMKASPTTASNYAHLSQQGQSTTVTEAASSYAMKSVSTETPKETTSSGAGEYEKITEKAQLQGVPNYNVSNGPATSATKSAPYTSSAYLTSLSAVTPSSSVSFLTSNSSSYLASAIYNNFSNGSATIGTQSATSTASTYLPYPSGITSSSSISSLSSNSSYYSAAPVLYSKSSSAASPASADSSYSSESEPMSASDEDNATKTELKSSGTSRPQLINKEN